MPKSDTTITLKGINGVQTILSYIAKTKKKIDVDVDPKEEMPQRILDVTESKGKTEDDECVAKGCIGYLNAHKKNIKVWVRMYDIVSKGVLPLETNCKCL